MQIEPLEYSNSLNIKTKSVRAISVRSPPQKIHLSISTFSNNSVTPIIITISVVFVGTAISLIPIDLFQLINPYLFTGYVNIFLTAFYDPIPWAKILKMFYICGIWSLIFILLSFYKFETLDITE